MDLFNISDLKSLIQKPEGWCVSIYMPTHRFFPNTKQNAIRYKNLLAEADARLWQVGLRPSERKKMFKPAMKLLKEGYFRRKQGFGLAAFLNAKRFHYYQLPLEFEDLVVVTDRFHIKPLIPLFINKNRFYILALNQKGGKLFQCTGQSIEEMPMPKISPDTGSSRDSESSEKQSHIRVQTRIGSGERSSLVHGYGSGTDNGKKQTVKLFHHIKKTVQPLLSQAQVPLVLAGMDYLLPIYREISRYPFLLEEGIMGNPAEFTLKELHQKAWDIVEPLFLSSREEAKRQYSLSAETGQTSDRLEEIAPGAFEGHIETLFVPIGIQQWGVFDSKANHIDLHRQAEPGDEDLLDFSAIHTFLHGGKVYALKPEEMPDETMIAAIYR